MRADSLLTPVAFCKMSIGFKTTGLNTSTPNLALEQLLFSSPVEQSYQLKTWNAANFPSSAVSQRHSDCDTLATLLLFFFFSRGHRFSAHASFFFYPFCLAALQSSLSRTGFASSCCIRTLKFPQVIMALFCILSVGGRKRGAGWCEGVYTCGVKSDCSNQ